jgi:hypothetical protein
MARSCCFLLARAILQRKFYLADQAVLSSWSLLWYNSNRGWYFERARIYFAPARVTPCPKNKETALAPDKIFLE